jgi:hypothetical protein
MSTFYEFIIECDDISYFYEDTDMCLTDEEVLEIFNIFYANNFCFFNKPTQMNPIAFNGARNRYDFIYKIKYFLNINILQYSENIRNIFEQIKNKIKMSNKKKNTKIEFYLFNT